MSDSIANPESLESPNAKVLPRRRSEARWIRTLLVMVLVGTTVALVILYRKNQGRQTALLRIQQACLGYQQPADSVVYEENPTRAAELLARGGEYVRVQGGAGDPPITGHMPEVWRGMKRWAMPNDPAPPRDAVLFLHERESESDGTRFLVCVEADRAARRLRITLIHPGGSTLDPAALNDITLAPRPQEGLLLLATGGDPFDSRLPPADAKPDAPADLRFFAGQIDANDAVHFTLGFEKDGRRGEIGMWVHDEQTIYFTTRELAGR